uniref:F-box domain-containing protein n=1 Tax=Lates calcarifer TaxID=8187 RepID=A0A4W6FH58_LATCA
MVRKASRNVGKSTLAHKSQPYKRTPRPTRTIMTRSQCITSTSFFHGLPPEVFGMILDNLSVPEISVFSMVSKEITKCVVDYISTLVWKNKMIIQGFHHSTRPEQRSTIEHYRNLGLLFKRCTLLLPTKERLNCPVDLFQIPCFKLEQCLAADCIGFSSYGVFLQTLMAGWGELECHRGFNFLCELTNLLQKIEAVTTTKPGVWHQELQIRRFCRQVLLDPWPKQPQCQFWLIQLLKPWPIVSQAHLLFILYGPLQPDGTLGWQDLVERGLPHSALWDLARAILRLFGKLEVKGWTTGSVLAILEELIVIPHPWHVENVARLLVLCGRNLCFTVLANKALNGRHLEISRLIVYIILVRVLCSRVYKVFSTGPERFCFIQQLENIFSEITKEIFEFSVASKLQQFFALSLNVTPLSS